jgi:hypothetical protein
VGGYRKGTNNMVKSKKGANKTASTNVSTEISEEKPKTWVLDDTLSPLICRKLKFNSRTPGNFKDNKPRKIVSHNKSKKIIQFEIEWEPKNGECFANTKINDKTAKENCSDLLIDYLLSKL